MTNILTVSCMHGDIENLMGFTDKLMSIDLDVVVCPGDFTDYFLPKGFSREDIAEIILEEFKRFHKPILVVPGSWDKDLIGFFEKKGISLHGHGIVIGDVGFYGYGGAKTPFNTPLEPSENEIEAGLEKAYKDIEHCGVRIQVTHAPPARTKVDVITTGAHVGSEAVRKVIERKKPDVAICSHIHEGRGTDVLGGTKIINSGRFPEGHCGLVSIDGKNSSVKMLNLI